MKTIKYILTMSVMALGLVAGSAQAVTDIAGVKVEDSINVKGNTLVLNGAGIRYKAVFKVYVAALYVNKKTTSVEEVLTQPGAKYIRLTMLRDIDANELGKLFSRSMQDNMPKSDFGKLIPSILRMSQMFTEYKNLKAGDTFSMEWIPDVGAIGYVKGKQFGEPFKDPEFFNAMLRIWLGPNPADWKLKDSLLGK